MIWEMYVEWKELWRNEWYLPGTDEYSFLIRVLVHLDMHYLPTQPPSP